MSDDWNTVTVIGNRRGGGTGGGNKDRQVDIFLFSVGFFKWVDFWNRSYIEKITCVEKDSRNITRIIKPRRQTYADSAFQRMSMSRWTWPGGRGWQALLRRNMGQEETLRYLVYPALCEVLLYKTHLNQISERNELKHGKAGSRDWGAQPQEGKLCA